MTQSTNCRVCGTDLIFSALNGGICDVCEAIEDEDETEEDEEDEDITDEEIEDFFDEEDDEEDEEDDEEDDEENASTDHSGSFYLVGRCGGDDQVPSDFDERRFDRSWVRSD